MRTLLLLPALLAAGCVFTHGTEISDLMVADGVHGERAVVVAQTDPSRTRTVRGELLHVSDSALLMLAGDEILLVPLGAIRRGRIGGISLEPGLTATEALRRHARYATGLTPAQMRELLTAHGQNEPVNVAPSHRDEERPPAHLPRPDSGPQGPAGPPALTGFLSAAREAGDRFQTVDAAIAAGYRRLGPSFPGMGEHWIHPGLIVNGEVDPARPPVLCYARVAGEPRLIAAAFTVPLAGDETPPDFPAGAHVWHDHAARVDEESLLLAHPASHGTHQANEQRGPRLAMFHAWLWVENPDGVLAQNNWRLPFTVAGIDIGDAAPSADAARAISLLTAGPDYYVRLFGAAAELRSEEREKLREILAAHAMRVRRWAEDDGSTAVAEKDLVALEQIWASLWEDIRVSVGVETWTRLAMLR